MLYGKQWRIIKRKMILSNKMVRRIEEAPVDEEVLRMLLLPRASVIDYFSLIKKENVD